MAVRRSGWTWFLGVVIVGVLADGWRSEAGAIPAFTRTLNVPCRHCHTIPPALNDAGEAFRVNGHRLVGPTQPGTEPTPEPGATDPPAGVDRADWPLSARTIFGYSYRSRDNQDTDLGDAKVQTRTFGTERLEVLLGGPLARNTNFFVRYRPEVSNADLWTAEGQAGELDSAWVRVNDIAIGSSLKINMKFGAFELDVPMSQYRRHSLSTASVSGRQVAIPIYGYFPTGSAAADDPETTLDWSRAQRGAEVSGRAPGGLAYSLALINGTNGRADSNKALDYYLRVYQPVERSHAGGFLYWGTASANAQFTPTAEPIPGTGQSNHPFYRIGVDGDIRSAPLRLFTLVAYGRDSAGLFGGSDPQDASFWGGFLELQYDLLADWSLLWALRYDIIRNLDQGDATTDSHTGDLDGVTWAVRYDWMETNRVALILHGEYSHSKTEATSFDGNDQIDNRFTAALDLMF
ncbi:MAG: hypothetical protein ACOYXR_07055 [Nitrospirota bacterium]